MDREPVPVLLDPDPVIDAYKPGIDLTLLRQNLALTPTERVQPLMRLMELAEEARRAGRVPSVSDFQRLITALADSRRPDPPPTLAP